MSADKNILNEKNPVDLRWGVRIPMRDGVQLNATLYQPQEMPDPLPVIFTLSPYIADTYTQWGMYFARNGYIFAAVDLRGRGNSEGTFAPLDNDANDGYDLVEWFAAQPWCNAKVGMWGGSYGGFNQWCTLKEFPPHLCTIIPVAAAHPAVDMPFYKNIFYPYEMQWLTLVSGVTPNANLFGDSAFWTEKLTRMFKEHLPFKFLDQLVGNPSPHFQKNVVHPSDDAYWQSLAPTPEDYACFDVPILTITGHYDGDQPGAMAYYQRHMQYGSAEAKANHYLVVGPWDHPGTRQPKKEMGGLKFDDASLVDMNELNKQWYDWVMKDGEKPDFLKKRVAYYVMGQEEWKYADSYEEIATETYRYFLDSFDGQPNDTFQAGILSENAAQHSPADHYVYDPLDIRPADLEQKEKEDYLLDQSYPLNLFGNGLVYHTAPFEEDTEISGCLKLVVSISMDVPDTDFMATVYEIQPDGTSVQLTRDYMRARYRESRSQEKLVVPGEINEYLFDWFTFFSKRIQKGSRLRLVFSSPNSIQMQKNYNSGGVVSQETAKDARVAHITLHHDDEHTSYLEVPVNR
jgi:putative CocE/NonD family hydrolase